LITVFGARFPLERLMIIVVAVVFTTGLLLLLRYTKAGLAMRAVAQDSDAASVSGVSIPRTATTAMFIGCAMAAAAAGIIAPVFTVHAYMAEGYLIKAFMVIILGGMGSITGAIWAGILVGFFDAFGSVFFGYFTQIFLLIFVIVVIIFKPTGLFGGVVFDIFTRDE
jgi:branched-chain amino acid transport system permease protein